MKTHFTLSCSLPNMARFRGNEGRRFMKDFPHFCSQNLKFVPERDLCLLIYCERHEAVAEIKCVGELPLKMFTKSLKTSRRYVATHVFNPFKPLLPFRFVREAEGNRRDLFCCDVFKSDSLERLWFYG